MLQQRIFDVELTGETGLIMHADDLMWRDMMGAWENDPENKRISKKGDDRTPAWRWLGVVYHDEDYIGIPADNLMTCIREGAAKVSVGQGNARATYKKQSQSGVSVNEPMWPIKVNGKKVPWAPIAELKHETSFSVHQQVAQDLGFMLFVKGAKIGRAKHIRVRPRFDHWTARGTVVVHDETLTQGVLTKIFGMAGRYCGLGDWRPSTATAPGPWGKFAAKISEVL